MIDIKKLIDNKSIKIFFQVILSPTDTQSLSVEAFARGVDPETGDIIMPGILFPAAYQAGLHLELETLCIQKSMEKFQDIHTKNPTAMLYLNIGFSYFNTALQENTIIQSADDYQIPYERIALDINQITMHEDNVSLINKFVSHHRQANFYISIDDIGKDYFNIDKILLCKPDIIKLNHQMMNRLKDKEYLEYMKQYLIDIAHKMGMLVISTGIEHIHDIRDSLEAGAQMIQGYYVSDTAEYNYDEIMSVLNKFDRSSVLDIIETQYDWSEKEVIFSTVQFITKLRMKLTDLRLEDADLHAQRLMGQSPYIESGYIIDKEGIQLTPSYINISNFGNRNKELFGLYDIGTDHSHDEVCQRLKHDLLTDWVTRPYRSKLTNNICITGAFKINTNSDYKIIVMHINVDSFMRQNRLKL